MKMKVMLMFKNQHKNKERTGKANRDHCTRPGQDVGEASRSASVVFETEYQTLGMHFSFLWSRWCWGWTGMVKMWLVLTGSARKIALPSHKVDSWIDSCFPSAMLMPLLSTNCVLLCFQNIWNRESYLYLQIVLPCTFSNLITEPLGNVEWL